MPLMKWDPSFNIGVSMIDEQHRMLVQIANELYEAILSKKDKPTLQRLINKLSMYTVFHFSREEHYFEVLGYPDSDRHIQAHKDFEDKVNQFENDFDDDRQQLPMEMLRFLGDWLVKHIQGSDKAYAPFFKSRGIV